MFTIINIIIYYVQEQKKVKKEATKIAWDLEANVNSAGSLPKTKKNKFKLVKSDTCWNSTDMDAEAEFEKNLMNVSVDLTKEKVIHEFISLMMW